MQRDPAKYLHDILKACELLMEFTHSVEECDFYDNLMLRSAIERQMIILGEALSKMSKEFPDMAEQIPDRTKIIAFRNILVHAYDGIDDEIVWSAVQSKVPELKKQVWNLLQS